MKPQNYMRIVLAALCFLFLGEVWAETIHQKETKAAGYGLGNPETNSDGITTWDCIYFGSYWQNDTNGDGIADKSDAKQPIKWRVLSVNGADAFLLADGNLDCQRYNETDTQVTWETCTLRHWLNNDFYQNAFNSSEREAVPETSVVNKNNPVYGTEGGNNTIDKVYLLSVDEASNAAYGFSCTDTANSATREGKNSMYARCQGAYNADNGNSWWWLRTPGSHSGSAADVGYFGKIYSDGFGVSYKRNAVRPVLHLNLATMLWKNAGKVRSQGSESGQDTGIDRIGKDTVILFFKSEGKQKVKPPAGVKSLKIKSKKGNIIFLSWKKSRERKAIRSATPTTKSSKIKRTN